MTEEDSETDVLVAAVEIVSDADADSEEDVLSDVVDADSDSEEDEEKHRALHSSYVSAICSVPNGHDDEYAASQPPVLLLQQKVPLKVPR